MFLKRQCTVFSILFAFAEKGEAGSGELEAACQRAAHPGAAEASLRGSGQGGPWRTRQVWRGGGELGNQGPILLRDQVSSVPVPQTCVSQALRPVHVEKGVQGVLESGFGCSASPALSAQEGACYGLDLVLSPLGAGDRCLHLLALCCPWGCDHLSGPQVLIQAPLTAPAGSHGGTEVPRTQSRGVVRDAQTRSGGSCDPTHSSPCPPQPVLAAAGTER